MSAQTDQQPVQPTVQTHTFSEHELRTLTAICNTLIPALDLPPDPDGFFARNASALGVPPLVANTVAGFASEAELTQIKLGLGLLDSAFVNGVLHGNSLPFADMNLDQRTAVLRAWAHSRLEPQRRIFQLFKRLAMFMFYSINTEKKNPSWDRLGYSGPPPITSSERPIKPLEIADETTLHTDAVIIGSGAGGGVVAGELTAAGYDVIVLEKGGYYAEPDFDGYELTSTEKLFEKRGLMSTSDLGVTILAGSTLGGGTTINWAASFRTPDYVLREWERDYGVTAFTGSDYQASLDAVCERIHVNEAESAPNAQNTMLEHGAKALGYQVGIAPRNVKGCEDCGFCGFGCTFGAKQSTLRTYLHDAYTRGARIIVRAHAERVIIQNGRASGVIAHVIRPDGSQRQITIRARVVVAAAGSLHTPALLLRSGLTNAHIGRNLHLHPTTVTYGLYDQAICGWSGAVITRYVRDFTNLSSNGYGVVLETAPVHPGIGALALPWSDGLQHKNVMRQITNLSNHIIIARDRAGGRITLDKRGDPVVHYTPSGETLAHLMRGITESLRIHRAAGAWEVSAPHVDPRVFRSNEGGDFEGYLSGVRSARLVKNGFALLSAHQMSSCRMGSNPARGALAPTGETFEVDNLYVADGSALPTATGVNPMITIMAVAHTVAQHIKQRLN